ncbi:MAG: ATP-binding cassette domain-containing protein, partial [Verrucomicrobiales bacterium]|nr:ATP-binding cassette domain-containing protein [Verrucomicrobiales bacterium]
IFHFHDTIRANIRYGNLDATDEEIEAAAIKAHAHEFILEQSNGYETMLGDKGRTLSGGQQQRVSIARAILRDAPILFLDEATSSLDPEVEKKVQDAIEVLAEGKTVIAIAHRLSTVLDSDEIIVLRNGKVVDRGPHSELIGRCKEYEGLYELQFKGADS